MKRNDIHLFSFILLIILSGCSSIKKPNYELDLVKEEQKLKIEAQSTQTPGEMLQKIEDQMVEMVKKAKEKGPDGIEFLAGDLFIKASDASIRGDAQTAAFLLNHLISLKPNDYYIKKKYAVELIRTGELQLALPVLKLLYEKDDEAETIGLILGGVYTALKMKTEAQKTYHQILKKNSSNEEACVFLSKSFVEEDQYKKAYKLLSKCEKKSKKKGIFAYYKGKMALQQDKKKQAYKYFVKALKRSPDYYQAALAIGLIHEEKEEFKAASKVYKSFLKTNPDSYPILNRVFQVLTNSNASAKEVIPYAEKLSSIDPTDLNLKVRLGLLYHDENRYNEAKGLFKEILIAVPSSDKVLYQLASLYQETQDFELAIEYFNKIEEESTLFLDANLQISQIMGALATMPGKNLEKWRKEFISLTSELREKHISIKVEIGMILASFYENVNQFDKAIETILGLKKLEDYTDNHEYYLATLYEKISDYSSSRNLIKEMLKKNPKDAHALNFLGYSFLETNEELGEAYKLISQAVNLRPEDAYIRDSLGWYYYKVGKYKKALKEIEKAWSLVKTDGVITKHLGMVHKKLSNFNKAEMYLVEALKLCKDPLDKREVMNALELLKSQRLPASAGK